MTKIAAFIRRALLTISIILFLLLCVTKLDSTSTLGALLYVGVTFSFGGFLAFSILSIIIRGIRLLIMGKENAMRTVFSDVLVFSHNSSVIHFFRRVSFWGSVMAIINVVFLNVPRSMIYDGPYSPDLYLKGYHGFLLWSVVTLVIMFIISLLHFAFYLPHYGSGVYNVFQYTGKLIKSDVTCPIRVINLFFDASRKKSFYNYFSFITMIVFIIINVIGIIKTV